MSNTSETAASPRLRVMFAVAAAIMLRGGGPGLVRRPSGLPSIAVISLHCLWFWNRSEVRRRNAVSRC
jgi:hypothetical protein